ncbi:MAG: hypothetical protein ABUS79_05275 [Pseudomonadota bacterium]
MDVSTGWLTGGPVMKIYNELGIIPPVEVRPLQHFATYRDVRDGFEFEAAHAAAEVAPPIDRKVVQIL